MFQCVYFLKFNILNEISQLTVSYFLYGKKNVVFEKKTFFFQTMFFIIKKNCFFIKICFFFSVFFQKFIFNEFILHLKVV